MKLSLKTKSDGTRRGTWRERGIEFEFGFTTRKFPLYVQSCDGLRRLAVGSSGRGRSSERDSHMLCDFRSFMDCVPAVRGDLRNRRPAAGSPLKQKSFACGIQIHSDEIAQASGRRRIEFFRSTDGVVALKPDVRAAALSADCLPVLIAVPGKKPAVAAVHAGWKGTEARIAEKAVAKLKRLTGADPCTYRAMLGPSLRECCYEVGPEFVARFPETTTLKKSGKHCFDLPGENVRQLRRAGVLPNSIWDSGLCTICRSKDFYSYRREKEDAGRLISWISFALPNPS